MRIIVKFIAVVVLVSGTGYLGAMAAESGDHQERHIQQIENKW